MFKKHGGEKLALHINEICKSDYRRSDLFLSKQWTENKWRSIFHFSRLIDKLHFVLNTEIKYDFFKNKNSVVLHTDKLVSVAS